MQRLILGGLAVSALALSAVSVAFGAEEPDRSRSPYFVIKGGDPAQESMPLEETKAELEVAGVIARVKLSQVYRNRGSKPLEAIYVFPASTRAAVDAMRMTIGERSIVAELHRREQARQAYDAARDKGQTASLLEQERPNVFQMSVANILPGDRIQVELSYSELLVPVDGVYQLLHPTVVGPRYASQPAAGDRWVANPTLHAGQLPPYSFSLHARISAGMPIRAVSSPSHQISPRFSGPTVVEVQSDDPRGGDRDFILRYRLAEDAIESGVLLYPGNPESFFLMMLEPPARVEPSAIPPRELIFIVDVSGSMMGFPNDVAKQLLRELTRGLRKQDRFNLMLFSGGRTVLAPASLPATPEAIASALHLLDAHQEGGATELVPAMHAALNLPRARGMSTSLVVITDGYVEVEKEVFSLIRESLGTANLFAFGIGSSVNRFLIEGMARAGMGQPFVVTSAGEAEDQATQFLRYLDAPVLSQVRIGFDGFDAYDIEPERSPDLFSRKPVLLFGKYRGTPSGAITVSGQGGNGLWSKRIELAGLTPDPSHQALRALWARHVLQRLSDDQQLSPAAALSERVTALALRYGLLSAGTSLVAIDSAVRNTRGTSRVIQPLPLPAGVSDSAIGRISSSGLLGSIGHGVGDASGLGGLGLSGTGVGGYGRGVGGAATQPATLRLEAPAVVSGSLDKNVILRVIRANQARVKYCYERELLRKPGLRGRLTIRLLIDGSGKVSRVELASSTLNDAALESCVQKVAASLLFPTPAGGGQVIVNYPFLFAPPN